MPVRLEPAAPLSRVKHSTTEPLHSRDFIINRSSNVIVVLQALWPRDKDFDQIILFIVDGKLVSSQKIHTGIPLEYQKVLIQIKSVWNLGCQQVTKLVTSR